MKKFVAAIIAVTILFTIGTGTFALVAAGEASERNPPVFISNLVVADAWMSGLTRQNWNGALQEQVYVEGSYIWFIATISVSAYDDTDSAPLWFDGTEEALLTVTSQNYCLNFSSASLASFAKIRGMDVLSEQIDPNSSETLVDARANTAIFKFSCQTLPEYPIIENETLIFQDDLAHLKMDGIFPADILSLGAHDATLQKDYYLHFMAVANAATEGVCVATLKVDDTEAQRFYRDPEGQLDENATYFAENWWVSNDADSSASLNPGDRSYIYHFNNTVNGKTYSIMKINSAAAAANLEGPFIGTGSIYVIMNYEATRCYFGFAVSGGRIQGLVYWNSNYRGRGVPGAFGRDEGAIKNKRTWDAGYYSELIENNNGNDLTRLDRNIGINATELRALFTNFGIARTNPGTVSDATFLAPGTGRSGASRSARETSAEARYNVSSGNSEFDDLFVTENNDPERAPWPSPTAAPTLTLPGPPFGISPTPEPEPSAETSPSP